MDRRPPLRGLLVALLVVAVATAGACRGDSGSAVPVTPTAPSPTPTPTPEPTPPATFALSGTITSTAGGPVANAEVWLNPFSKPATAGVKTDANGAYRITGLLPRSYAFLVQRDLFEPQQGDVTVSADTVRDFALRPGVTVSGHTYEEGVGDLGGVSLTVMTGPSAGLSTTSTAWGAYTLGYVTPGAFSVRVSKSGYEPVDAAFDGAADTRADFTLRWSYGACLTSIAPLLFERFPSAGGAGTFLVAARPGPEWAAIPSDPWIEVITGHAGTGDAPVVFRVDANANGATDTRRGAVQVRCGGTDGQNVWIDQYPDCQTRLTWTDGSPEVFPSAESLGSVKVTTGVPGCHWEAVSQADWIRTTGIRSWYGDNTARFVVEANTTGTLRTGIIVIGEQLLRVVQQ